MEQEEVLDKLGRTNTACAVDCMCWWMLSYSTYVGGAICTTDGKIELHGWLDYGWIMIPTLSTSLEQLLTQLSDQQKYLETMLESCALTSLRKILAWLWTYLGVRLRKLTGTNWSKITRRKLMDKMITEFKMLSDMCKNLKRRYQLTSLDYMFGQLRVHMDEDEFINAFGDDYEVVDKFDNDYLWLEHHDGEIVFFALRERGMDLREKFFFLTEKAKSHDA